MVDKKSKANKTKLKIEDFKALIREHIPYHKTIGIEVQEIGDGKATLELIIRKELTQVGNIHGGALASLIDCSCSCAAFSATYPYESLTTIDLQVVFIKPASKGALTAKAECLRSGKNICFCEAKIWNENGELVCTGSSQLMIRD
ncbi:MAG: PaaI family thioesterase [Promethearchaeota archaeon]